MTLPNLIEAYNQLKQKSKPIEKYLFQHEITFPEETKEMWLDTLKKEYLDVNFVGSDLLTISSKSSKNQPPQTVFNVIPIYNIFLAGLSYPYAKKVSEGNLFVNEYIQNNNSRKAEIVQAKSKRILAPNLEAWIHQHTSDDEEFQLVHDTLTNYVSWGGGKTLDRKDCSTSAVYNALSVSQSLSDIHEVIRLFSIYGELFNSLTSQITNLEAVSNESVDVFEEEQETSPEYRSGGQNIIYYGAPGTGKSYGIKNYIQSHGIPNYDPQTGSKFVYRITLYPEYDYSDFVGQLLPNVKKDGQVTYDFTEGAFTSALRTAIDNPSQSVFLVMEEMSRANVAAVFGDLFQLLDRDANGKSEYTISNGLIAEKAFKNEAQHAINIENNAEALNSIPVYIPSNLTIIGTVNTNDQNVYAMDTAFKRRFIWKYVSTNIDPKAFYNNATISLLPDFHIKWANFYQSLNHFIVAELHLTEDKQIGPYFINFQDSNKTDEDNQPILVDESRATEMVRDKLLQYLWEDVESAAVNTYTEKTLFDSSSIDSFSELYDKFGKEQIFSNDFLQELDRNSGKSNDENKKFDFSEN